MKEWSPITLLTLGLVVGIAAGGPLAAQSPAGVVSGDATDPEGGEYGVPLQEGDVDRIVMEVDVEADGSAAWRIEHRIRLDDAATTAGFEETRRSIEADREAVLANFTETIRAMATTAETETGRAMVVENVSVAVSREQLPQEYGVVAYSFRWYGFADPDGDLRVGDAVPGLFLDGKTTLLVSWPGEATLATVSPDPDDRRDKAVVWHGPLEFASGEPAIVLESETLSFGPDLVWDVSSNDSLVALTVLVLFAGMVSTGSVALYRRLGGGTEAPDTGEGESGSGRDAGTAEPASAGDTGVLPEELLSNEERVLRLLDDRGGRVKQQDVVEALDWSETKTSEVVSELREADRIEVYRLGRNNVLALPETGLGYESDDENRGGNR
jgi:hypothetical protein